jgi:hypothetical protein
MIVIEDLHGDISYSKLWISEPSFPAQRNEEVGIDDTIQVVDEKWSVDVRWRDGFGFHFIPTKHFCLHGT